MFSKTAWLSSTLLGMNIQLILSAIDEQISRLEQARAMLTAVEASTGLLRFAVRQSTI
jgi:hypothetical protein